MKLYRYVFYCLFLHQKKRIRNEREAAWSAACLLATTPFALLTAGDYLSSKLLETTLLMDRLGRWSYLILVFGSICVVTYLAVGTRSASLSIVKEFEHSKMRWGHWIVTAYFVVPSILFVSVLLAT